MDPNTHDTSRQAELDRNSSSPYTPDREVPDRNLSELDTDEADTFSPHDGDQDSTYSEYDREHAAVSSERTDLTLATDVVRDKAGEVGALIRRYPAVAVAAVVAVGFILGRTLTRRFT